MPTNRAITIFCLSLLFLLVSCGRAPATDGNANTSAASLVATSTMVATAPPTATTTTVPTITAPTATAPAATVTASPTATMPPAAPPTWPAPADPIAPFAPVPITPEEAQAAATLAETIAPERDDIALALAYGGVRAEEIEPAVTSVPPVVGATETFSLLNNDSNSFVPVVAQLLAVGDHAYFWFDTSYPLPPTDEVETVASAFDSIYETVSEAFGEEANPGIDGDPRLHIVHGSPAALCANPNSCGLAGYFSSSDALPRAVREHSNERDMFVMNADKFGTGFYLNVLAHEYRHMIEDNYDQADLDWEIEGSASLAEELAGFSANPTERGNTFLQEPDQQLNRWTDGNTYTYYGQGYLLNRYIYDRLGPELYREFATDPADGLDAITAVARRNSLGFDGLSLWLDWLTALAIHDNPQADARYRIGDGDVGVAEMVEADTTFSVEASVHQFAADYYHLTGTGEGSLQFTGSRRVKLLDTGAASGQYYWYAQRANYSHMQLTRAFDLRQVAAATLNYSIYHDIEHSYDFAYVSLSTDGGVTWEGLVAEQMQGLAATDNPSGMALTPRFYTGASGGWLEESIDLTPYAGQEILLRFSYITDPILTFGGLALDDISIPEIGFYDDAETANDGWIADGFTRTPATLPQPWHLMLITFPGGTPQVHSLAVSDEQTVQENVDLSAAGGEAILIVASAAPQTLQQASYRLQFAE